MKNFVRSLILILILCCTVKNPAHAYNLKQVAGTEKLSNSYITALCQDDKGIMWIGTYDGLNTYNGREIVNYNPSDDKGNLSGNYINNIAYTGDNLYWIQNYHGLNKYNTSTNKLEILYDFKKIYYIEKDKNNNLFIIKEDNCVYFYHRKTHTFKKIIVSGVIFSDILRFFIDNENNMWVASKKGTFVCFKISGNKATAEIELIPNKKNIEYKQQLINCFYNDNSINSIDNDYNFYSYDLNTGEEKLVTNLAKEIKSKGAISAAFKYNNRFFVGFQTGGVKLFEKDKNTERFKFTDIDINCGISCIKKDRFQDILWIGTDGQGLYIYSETSYSIKSTILNNETYKIGHPIKALLIDKEQTLWIGTKGDGILKIFNYDANKSIANCKTEKQTTENSLLNSNAVFCFAKSKRNIIWIGNDEGLNYYSYKEKKIKRIKLDVDNLRFKYIYDIYEDKNSDLWIVSAGMGIVYAHFDGTINDPVIKTTKHYAIKNNEPGSNFFFSIYPENDSIIWFANKGNGPFKFNTITKNLIPICCFDTVKPHTIKDIFSINKDKSNHFLFGSGYGLIQYSTSGSYKIFNAKNGFLNKTVQAILHGSDNSIWLSTNRGIVLFNSENNAIRIFEGEYIHNIVEFSSGSAFKDDKTGTLFFGGINGFVSIIERNIEEQKYMPPIFFGDFTLFGTKATMAEFITKESHNDVLNLKYNQNLFSLSFTAVDYLNGNNYSYYYKLAGFRDQWINNGRSNIATFTNISPGNYTLQVKYYNRTDGCESPVYSIKIHVNNPWYKTFWVYCIYVFLLIAATLLVIRYISWRIKNNEQKRLDEIEKKHHKEMIESKLDFFTNITHEFCAPLTLISGPCERILLQTDVSRFVINYIKMIKTNANRLNSLIQELIEFRKIETENRTLQIESLSIPDLIADALASFDVMADSKSIGFETIVPDIIKWNTDMGFFLSIVINLLSNAFKYTPNGKNIRFELAICNDMLIIKIANEGNIDEKDFVQIFDKYTTLQNFEKNDNNQSITRTGLGLAISLNMVKLLKGTITVENTPENWVLFTVSLPEIEIDNNQFAKKSVQRYIPTVGVPTSLTLREEEFDRNKQTILIIDDDVDLLLFISEIFSDQYNTIRLQDSTKIDAILKEFYPNLIISDIMMSGLNGMDLIKKIKGTKETNHIPIVLVSAKHEIEQQIEALSLGAEMYITKPFNTEFLKMSVNTLFERKGKFKDYLSTPISSFELADGKLTHKDHRIFLQMILTVINDNIANPGLSAQFIAEKLGIGSRSLYRKLEEMGEVNPSTLIRDSRLFVAKNLLIQTTLTIDEIVYKSGFVNRPNFYKVFSKKYNCTPKEYRTKSIDDITK